MSNVPEPKKQENKVQVLDQIRCSETHNIQCHMEGPRGSEIHNIMPSKPALRGLDMLKEDN
jgi:hypothetical protein